MSGNSSWRRKRKSCESTYPDKTENGVTAIIADETSPMSEEAWNYMIERTAAKSGDERRG